VEREAVQRSLLELRKADLLLFLVDSSQGLSEDDNRIWRLIQGKERILVKNKIDLPSRVDLRGLTGDVVEVSAQEGRGIEELWQKIKGKLFDSMPLDGSQFLLVDLRHWRTLQGIRGDLTKAQDALGRGLEEAAVVNLRGALQGIGELTGEKVSPDILEGIFSRFCIGK